MSDNLQVATFLRGLFYFVLKKFSKCFYFQNSLYLCVNKTKKQ